MRDAENNNDKFDKLSTVEEESKNSEMPFTRSAAESSSRE